jgi:hypothetical protein
MLRDSWSTAEGYNWCVRSMQADRKPAGQAPAWLLLLLPRQAGVNHCREVYYQAASLRDMRI